MDTEEPDQELFQISLEQDFTAKLEPLLNSHNLSPQRAAGHLSQINEENSYDLTSNDNSFYQIPSENINATSHIIPEKKKTPQVSENSFIKKKLPKKNKLSTKKKEHLKHKEFLFLLSEQDPSEDRHYQNFNRN